jgi:hypothetical protein
MKNKIVVNEVKRKPKAGMVSIMLYYCDVQDILLNSPRGNANAPGYQKRLYQAVATKFSTVLDNVEREKAVHAIVFAAHKSPEAQTIEENYKKERKNIDAQYFQIRDRQTNEIQELTQKKLDEAGIKDYKADGYGFRHIDGKILLE